MLGKNNVYDFAAAASSSMSLPATLYIKGQQLLPKRTKLAIMHRMRSGEEVQLGIVLFNLSDYLTAKQPTDTTITLQIEKTKDSKATIKLKLIAQYIGVVDAKTKTVRTTNARGEEEVREVSAISNMSRYSTRTGHSRLQDQYDDHDEDDEDAHENQRHDGALADEDGGGDGEEEAMQLDDFIDEKKKRKKEKKRRKKQESEEEEEEEEEAVDLPPSASPPTVPTPVQPAPADPFAISSSPSPAHRGKKAGSSTDLLAASPLAAVASPLPQPQPLPTPPQPANVAMPLPAPAPSSTDESEDWTIFTGSLEWIMLQQADEHPDLDVPLLLTKLLKAIKKLDGLETEYIFKPNVEPTLLDSIIRRLEGGVYKLKTDDPHVPANVLKVSTLR